MTISSTTNRVDYTGNGATSVFPYTFRIFDEDDLLVTVRDTDDVETTYVISTNYTVSGVGSESGGNVTLTAGALTTGYIITIRRVLGLTQSTDIRNQGDFFPETHEDAFDRFVMIDQQQQDEIDRSMRLPETVDPDDFDVELPAAIAGSNGMALVTNSTGDGWDVGPEAGDIADAQANAAAAAASATAAAASAASAATFAVASPPYGLHNIGLSRSVAANALTITMTQADGTSTPSTGNSAVKIYFRSSSLTSGAVVERSVTSALSITVPSGATLGHNDGIADHVFIYAIDNAGTVEMAVSSSSLWEDNGIISTTAIGTGSDDSGAIYSASARTSVACRLIGRIVSNQTTAGTWASSPTYVRTGVFDKENLVLTRTASFNAKHGVLYLVSTAAARTVTLPVAQAGFRFTIKDSTGSALANNITIARAGAESIEGVAANYTLTRGFGSWEFLCDGTDWFLNRQVDQPQGNVVVDAGNGHGATNTKIRRFSNIRANTGTSITYADDANAGGSFTINENGIYAITYTDVSNSSFGITVGATGTTNISSLEYATGRRAQGAPDGASELASVSVILPLSATNVVRAHTDGAHTSTSTSVQFTICQVCRL